MISLSTGRVLGLLTLLLVAYAPAARAHPTQVPEKPPVQYPCSNPANCVACISCCLAQGEQVRIACKAANCQGC